MSQTRDWSNGELPIGPFFTRREAIALLGCLGACVAFAEPSAAQSSTDALAGWPSLERSSRPRFEDFHRLSRFLTQTDDLNESMSRTIYELVMAEPWGAEHLSRVYERMRRLSAAGGDVADVLTPERFEPGERWFVSHLLVTWYTGVYYHETGNRSAGFEHALVHRNLLDVRPIPTFCAGTYGEWSRLPSGVPVSGS